MLTKTISRLLNNLPLGFDQREARIILAHILKCEPVFLLAHPENPVPLLKTLAFQRLVTKRVQGWPLAYLLGKKAFFGRDFIVNTRTLIPRPETELLVEEVLRHLKKISPNFLLIDIGTGSGCIPITLSAEINNLHGKIIASDVSRGALKIAKKNNARLKTAVEFYRSDLLKNVPLEKLISKNQPQHSIITANLPYLTAEECAEPSIAREPKTALFAKDNGLALYKKLFEQFLISPLVKFPATLFFEINPAQAQPLEKFIVEKKPGVRVSILPDLAGLDRLIIVSA